MAFEITPVTTFPPAVGGPAPPRFIQFQINGVDVGGLDVATLNFTGDVQTTLSTDRGKITLAVAAPPPPPPEVRVFTGESLNQLDNLLLNLPFDGPAVAAKADFLAFVANPGYLTFEGLTTSDVFATTPLGPFSFSAPKASSSVAFTTTGANGQQRTLTLADHAADDLGRYNTTMPDGLAIYEFVDNGTLTFANPTYCFGFYATDVGDFDGQSKISITDASGTTTYNIPNSGVPAAAGNLIFWGIANSYPILSATLFCVVNPGGSADAAGLDDLILADRP